MRHAARIQQFDFWAAAKSDQDKIASIAQPARGAAEIERRKERGRWWLRGCTRMHLYSTIQHHGSAIRCWRVQM